MTIISKVKSLYGTSERKKVITNFLSLIILQGMNYIFPLILLPYLMPILGAEKYGLISFAQAVIAYFAIIVDFGFNLSATRKIAQAQDKKERSKIFWATTFAKVGLMLISFIILYILILTVHEFNKNLDILFIWFLTIIGSILLPQWLFQGLEKMRWIAIVTVISRAITLPLVFIFVKSSDDYVISLFIQASSILISGGIAVIIIYRKRLVSFIKISFKDILIEINDSKFLFLSSATISVYTAGFILILGFITTEAEVGSYAAADKIFRSLGMLILIPLLQALFPRISSLAATNLPLAIKQIRKTAIIISFIMGLISIFMFFSAEYIVIYLGKDYTNLTLYIQILSFLPIPWALGGIFAQLGLIACGNTYGKKRHSLIYLIVSIISLPTVFVLTYLYNGYGTIFAMIISELIVTILAYYYWQKTKIALLLKYKNTN